MFLDRYVRRIGMWFTTRVTDYWPVKWISRLAELTVRPQVDALPCSQQPKNRAPSYCTCWVMGCMNNWPGLMEQMLSLRGFGWRNREMSCRTLGSRNRNQMEEKKKTALRCMVLWLTRPAMQMLMFTIRYVNFECLGSKNDYAVSLTTCFCRNCYHNTKETSP